ncbi:unnamed protein product [uncultured bacterium]|nr:unnamed protein product [uncultured bacterium]
MPEYDFRIRFHFSGGNHINSEAEKLLVLQESGGATIRLRSGARGSAIKDHSRASLIGGTYPSAADAQAAAERTKRALLIWAVRHRVGIDLGGRQPRSVITVAGLELLEKQIGGPVRADIHGIDVYEHIDGLSFAALNADASIGKAAAAFVEEVAATVATPVFLNAKQELAGEILSASYFDAADRSRFVTLITAVEALLDPQPKPAAAQHIVARMIQIVEEGELDEGHRAAMLGSLRRLKRESIGKAGRTLAERLLGGKVYQGQTPAQFFTLCYGLRSSILHSGKVPAEITDFLSVCATAHAFVCDLLIASFGESQLRDIAPR